MWKAFDIESITILHHILKSFFISLPLKSILTSITYILIVIKGILCSPYVASFRSHHTCHYYNIAPSKLPPTNNSFSRKSFTHKLGTEEEVRGVSSQDPDV
jgi:hypothetical protein